MTMFRVGPAGIPASLKTDMNAVLNKKFGTSGQNYPPAGWPDDVNLLGPLPEKTTTKASIANLTDGADRVPIKAWNVDIAPNLSGVSSIDCRQTGINIFNQQTEIGGYNTSDGEANNLTDRIRNVGYISVKPSTQYYFYNGTDIASQSNINIVVLCYDKDKHYTGSYYYRNKTQPTLSNPANSYYIRFYCATGYGTTYNNDISINYPPTETAFHSYVGENKTASLGRTINGGSVDVVNGTADPTNLLDNTLTTQTVNGTTFTVNADKSITVSGTPTQQTRVYISQEAISINEAMFFSFGTMPTGTRVFCSRTSGGSTSYPTISPSHTATIDAVYTNFLLEIGTSFDGTPFTIYPLCNKGSSASDYSPYFEPFTFTPISPTPETKLGSNNFWADGDTQSQITYRADIALLLQALSGSRGLMMSPLRLAEPMIGEESDPEEENELEEPEITETEGDNDER